MRPITLKTNKDREILMDVENQIKELREIYPNLKIFVDLSNDDFPLDKPYFMDICPGKYVRFFNIK